MKRLISVIGAAECKPEDYAFAEAVGRLIASEGYGIVCGGRSGVMEAVCRGAQGDGGLTVGILPTTDVDEANPYLSVALPTGLGEARNVLVILAGEAVLAVGGGFGTLSEIAYAWKLGKPVVGYHTWEARSADGQEGPIHRVKSPDQALETLRTIVESKAQA